MKKVDLPLFDFSRQQMSGDALAAARKSLCERGVNEAFRALARGDIVNATEGRAATHMQERSPSGVDHTLLRGMADEMAARGITTVVNVGIGGSDLGLRLADDVFHAARCSRRVALRFCTGLDPSEWRDAIDALDPRATAFVLASKSFTTLETLTTGDRAKQWLGEWAAQNIYAVTTSEPRALEYGIQASNITLFNESVGGRYSLWSAINLPLRVAYGNERVDEMLAGAHAMDQLIAANTDASSPAHHAAITRHFNRNVLGLKSQVVVPYTWSLRKLAEYLQQLVMESNGKRVDINGAPINTDPCSAIWGTVGTAAQHAYFQWLHQHPDGAAVDIIAVKPHGDVGEKALFENAVAQARALTYALEPDSTDPLAAFKRTPGKRPNTFIGLNSLSPESLGTLLAFYEASVFFEAFINNINPFDQFGVEYGKLLAKQVASGGDAAQFDASTKALLEWGRNK